MPLRDTGDTRVLCLWSSWRVTGVCRAPALRKHACTRCPRAPIASGDPTFMLVIARRRAKAVSPRKPRPVGARQESLTGRVVPGAARPLHRLMHIPRGWDPTLSPYPSNGPGQPRLGTISRGRAKSISVPLGFKLVPGRQRRGASTRPFCTAAVPGCHARTRCLRCWKCFATGVHTALSPPWGCLCQRLRGWGSQFSSLRSGFDCLVTTVSFPCMLLGGLDDRGRHAVGDGGGDSHALPPLLLTGPLLTVPAARSGASEPEADRTADGATPTLDVCLAPPSRV